MGRKSSGSADDNGDGTPPTKDVQYVRIDMVIAVPENCSLRAAGRLVDQIAEFAAATPGIEYQHTEWEFREEPVEEIAEALQKEQATGDETND
jgi:hypothetical protein